jgi:uncharacterized repeat protein (TIGR01451 family)
LHAQHASRQSFATLAQGVQPERRRLHGRPQHRISTCAGGPNDYCQQQTDLDCDPRCDVGPNAGRSCTTNAFCNPGSDQGAVCAGTCQSTRFASMRPATPERLARRFASAVSSPAVLLGSDRMPRRRRCTQSAPARPGSVCSRQFNEGDTDYFSLGTFAANSKVFAVPDSKSANDQDFRMRIVSDTKTLQFNDDDGIGREGANYSGDRGSARLRRADLHPGQPTPRGGRAVRDPAIVRGPVASAQLESEAGPTGNDIYFGWPGDVINANYATSGGYVRGTFAVNGDSDCFKFLVNEGDLMDWFGDGNPDRPPARPPSSTSRGRSSMTPTARRSRTSSSAWRPVAGTPTRPPRPGSRNTSPDVGPPGYLQWRATYTGMLEVCFYDDSAALGLGTPNHPGAWVEASASNCGPLQPAVPGRRRPTSPIEKTVSAGPYLTGSFITYTITVKNNSLTDIAQEVHLVDTLDPTWCS